LRSLRRHERVPAIAAITVITATTTTTSTIAATTTATATTRAAHAVRRGDSLSAATGTIGHFLQFRNARVGSTRQMSTCRRTPLSRGCVLQKNEKNGVLEFFRFFCVFWKFFCSQLDLRLFTM
jgi:hypothetical protein